MVSAGNEDMLEKGTVDDVAASVEGVNDATEVDVGVDVGAGVEEGIDDGVEDTAAKTCQHNDLEKTATTVCETRLETIVPSDISIDDEDPVMGEVEGDAREGAEDSKSETAELVNWGPNEADQCQQSSVTVYTTMTKSPAIQES